MTNTKLFAKATQVAIENMRENEQLRTIMFLEGSTINALFRVEYAVENCEDYRTLDIRVEVEPLSYKAQLEMADAFCISPTELAIAQEINSCDCFENENDFIFDKACRLVFDTYFDIANLDSISYCGLVISSLFEYGYTLEHIEDMTASKRIATYEELC